MITLFNIWHYLALVVSLIIFIGGIALALQEEGLKYRVQVIISFGLISVLVAIFSMYTIDSYTKEAKIYRLDSKRILTNEKIMFSGVVKNEGKYEIGEVTLEIRMVNRGESTGSLKSGEFFKPNGFFDYFSYSNMHKTSKPQQIIEENVIATNLKPGESRHFTIYLSYPPYFSGFSHFTEVYAH